MTGYIGIGGKARKIDNMYIGVDGVARQVVKAYIGIGGKARLWYSVAPPLSELWSAATLVAHDSYVGASKDNASIIVNAATDPCWVFCCTGTGVCFAKIYDGACTYLKRITYGDSPAPTTLSLSEYGSSSTRVRSGSTYGVKMLALRFTDIPESAVDYAFKDMSAEIISGHSSSSNGSSVQIASTDITSSQNDIYIQAFASAQDDLGYFSACSGSAPTTAIKSHANGSSWASSVWWTLGDGNYKLNDHEHSLTQYKAGCICHLW